MTEIKKEFGKINEILNPGRSITNNYCPFTEGGEPERLIKRLSKIGIEIELVGNFPWVYLYKINEKLVNEKYEAEHGFTVGYLPIQPGQQFRFTSIKEIFKLIRKYCKEENSKTIIEETKTITCDEILIQLDKWIEQCEVQNEIFDKNKLITAAISSQAMAQAYRNVKQLIQKKIKSQKNEHFRTNSIV